MIIKIADVPIRIECKNRKWSKALRTLFKEYVSDDSRILYTVTIVIQKKKKKNCSLRIGRRNVSLITFPSSLKYLLRFNFYLKVIFSVPLLFCNGILIHSSSLVKRKKGFIFVGKQSQGKSTLQQIAKKYISYNDDFSILRKVNGKFYLYPSPFIETNSRTVKGLPVRLKKIFFIKKASKTAISSISKDLSFLQLLSNILRPNSLKSTHSYRLSSIQKEIGLVEELVEVVKCQWLEFEKNKTFLQFL